MDIKIKSAFIMFDDKKFREGCIIGGAIIIAGILMMPNIYTRMMGPALIGFGLGFIGAIYNNYASKNGETKWEIANFGFY